MGKKVAGITIAAGVGLGLGYLGYKYGRQFISYLKKREDRKPIDAIAEDIKATLKKNIDDFCKKNCKEDIKTDNSEEATLEEVLNELKNGKHILSEDKAEKNLNMKIDLTDVDEVLEKKESKIKSVEDLDREFEEIQNKMNAETYKIIDMLRKRREELAKEQENESVCACNLKNIPFFLTKEQLDKLNEAKKIDDVEEVNRILDIAFNKEEELAKKTEKDTEKKAEKKAKKPTKKKIEIAEKDTEETAK